MNQIQNRDSNKMGEMPVNKLLFSMAWPMMLSMLVQALYNIVDSIFVSHVAQGQDALEALTLAFPLQTLMIAFGAGTGVGMNALLSRYLGEKKYEEANETAKNGIFLAAINIIAFCLFAIFGARAFISSQTNSHQVMQFGVDYLKIVSGISLGMFMQMVLERLLQSTGNTFYTMISQGTGAIVNMILDPIFIFAFHMEVKGAAIATVIGQLVAMSVALWFNLHKNRELNLNMFGFRPSGNIIKKIYEVGLPSIIMQAVMSLTTYTMNRILSPFETAVAVYGAYFKLNSFIFMPIFGMNNGMIPIIGYNYGAKNKERIKQTVILAMKTALTIMVIGVFIFQLGTKPLLLLFDASSQMLSTGIPALRIISSSFLFAGACIIMISTLQALGEGLSSMIISLARQIGVLLPAAYLLARFFGVPYVWCAFPMAEFISLVISIFIYRRAWKRKVSVMES